MKICPSLLLAFLLAFLLTARECRGISQRINDEIKISKEQLAMDFNNHRIRRNSDIQFKDGDNGQVMWAERCDFPGTEIRQVPSKGKECGKLCIDEERCTHFSWSSDNCNLKMAQNARPSVSPQVGICGWVTARVPTKAGSSTAIPFSRAPFILALFVFVIGMCIL